MFYEQKRLKQSQFSRRIWGLKHSKRSMSPKENIMVWNTPNKPLFYKRIFVQKHTLQSIPIFQNDFAVWNIKTILFSQKDFLVANIPNSSPFPRRVWYRKHFKPSPFRRRIFWYPIFLTIPISQGYFDIRNPICLVASS